MPLIPPKLRLIIAVPATAYAIILLGGCAVGRTNSGGIVAGIEVGALPDGAGEFAQQAAGLLPPPWGGIASAALGVLGLGGAAAAAHAKGKDRGWDEAVGKPATPGQAKA